MDITNRSLALLLVAAIVVSLGSTIFSLNRMSELGFTGRAPTDTGIANITINTSVSITFKNDTIDFGRGYSNDTTGGVDYCPFDTNGTDPTATPCAGFNSSLLPFVIRNDGNDEVSLSLQSDTAAATFLGGTSPAFQLIFVDNDTGTCNGSVERHFDDSGTWVAINTSEWLVCDEMGFVAANDALQLHLRVSVPDNANPGSRDATFTATASG